MPSEPLLLFDPRRTIQLRGFANVQLFSAHEYFNHLRVKQTGGSASHHELSDKVIEIAKIPEDARGVAHTTGRESRPGYNLRWEKATSASTARWRTPPVG